jgi:hypothetical protein
MRLVSGVDSPALQQYFLEMAGAWTAEAEQDPGADHASRAQVRD